MAARPVLPVCALLLLAACAGVPRDRPPAATRPAAPAPAPPPPRCADCGVVEKLEALAEAATSGTAAGRPALGGLVGSVLAARPPAANVVHLISLRLDDGRRLQIRQTAISANLRVGSRVRLTSGRVILLR